MSCEACRDIEKEDGVRPDCKRRGGKASKLEVITPPSPPLTLRGGKKRGCLIGLDKLDYTAMRAIKIRNAVIAARELTGPEAALLRHGCTDVEFDLILAIEDELRAIEAENKE